MNINYLKTLMLGTALVASVSLVSCGDDDSNDSNVTKPTQVNPTGFVVLAHPDEVVNGDTATILVRINPSTVAFTKEQFTIDCVNSDIYTLKVDESAKSTRSAASYVQTSSNYTLVDLVPDTLGNDTLQGQWQAKVLVKTDQNIFDKSLLALVASYKDSEGKTVNVSSEPFHMTLVPTPGDGVTAWTPRMYTDSTEFHAESATPYYWIVTENTYENANGFQMKYEVDKRIRSTYFALETIDNDTTTKALDRELCDGIYVYSYLPLGDKKPFSDLKDGTITNYHAQSFFMLEDKTGHKAVVTDNCDYARFGVVTCEIDCPKELKKGETYTLNLDEALKDYGYSSESVNYFAGKYRAEVRKNAAINASLAGGHGWYLFYTTDDYKTLTVTVHADCDADELLPCLKAFNVSTVLRFTDQKQVAAYLIQLKRKGA